MSEGIEKTKETTENPIETPKKDIDSSSTEKPSNNDKVPKEEPTNIGTFTGKDPKTGQFLPGNTLSPGKPKGSRHFSTLLKELLQKEKVTLKDGRVVTMDVAMSMAMFKKALAGSEKAYELITDRHDGKPHQSMELEVTEPPLPIMPLPNKTGKKVVSTNNSNQQDIESNPEN